MVDAGSGRRVLVVDDDELSLRTTVELFRARGWQVEVAIDLRTALDAAIRYQPDVIVTEVLLPDAQTLQFARSLRGAVDHDVSIVALTRASEDVIDEVGRVGFDLAFGKPIDDDELERVVRRTTRMPKLT